MTNDCSEPLHSRRRTPWRRSADIDGASVPPSSLLCTSATIARDMALSAKQRQFLKGLAHPMSPVVRVGKGSVSDAVVEETKRSLAAHELIKVRIEAEGATE